MANIQKDPRIKIWSVRYEINGNQRTTSLKTKNEDVAYDRFQVWLKEEFPKLTSEEKRLSDLLDFWLSQTDTGDSHQNKVKAHWNEFKDYFDNVPATEITRDAINEYFIYWKTERIVKSGEIASETYRSNFFRSLRLAWLFALDRRYIIGDNVFQDIKKLKTSVRKKTMSRRNLVIC